MPEYGVKVRIGDEPVTPLTIAPFNQLLVTNDGTNHDRFTRWRTSKAVGRRGYALGDAAANKRTANEKASHRIRQLFAAFRPHVLFLK